MNILYIINAKIPNVKAHGYQVSKMCESFSDCGTNVVLWIPEKYNKLDKNIFDYYAIKNNFSVKILKSFDSMKYHRFLGRFAFFLQSFCFFVVLFFKKIPEDFLIYTRTPEIAFLFSIKNKKVVFEAHRWSNSRFFNYKLLLRKVYKIITVTNELKKVFLNNGFNEGKIIVEHDAVDLEKYDLNILQNDIRRKLNFPVGKKIIGYVGSFTTMGEGKGILEILNVLKSLVKEKPEIIFLAIGGSDEEIEHYKKISKDLYLLNNVFFEKRIGIENLPYYYKSVDILLMPFPDTEHYRYYMSPLKMFEYMASRRPIIATDLPSIREVLNENSSILIKPGNPQELKAAILKLLNNHELSNKLASQAYEDVKQYTWNNRARRILEFIGK